MIPKFELHTDVLVLGSGPSGFAAAYSAAKNGAKVILVEQSGDVGGISTSGMMSHWTGDCGSPLNVKEAAELGARRVGHGIALMKDETLMKELARTGLGVEMCPTSNLQTAAIARFEDYPLRSFEQAGLQISVNTDNRTVSGTTLTRELQFLLNSYQDEDLIRRLIDNAFQTAFAY